MDDKRFDSLTKALAKGASRRSVFKGLLGLGGAAVVGGAIVESENGVEAARRSTPTPKPPTCPGITVWNGSACVCPAKSPPWTQCVPNGPTCCNDNVAVGPGYSECCDNACCQFPDQCVGEEHCCPRLPDVGCLGPDGRCCTTLCEETLLGVDCCPADAFCPSGGGAESPDLCCGGDTPQRCDCGTNDNHCIPAGKTCCNEDPDCASLNTCDGLIWHQWVCGSEGYCVDQPVDCNDGKACTTDSCNAQTGCGHTVDCDEPPVCKKSPGSCDPDGNCTYPDLCSGDTPKCCPSDLGGYCIGATQTCCDSNEDCTVSCEICGAGGYCVSACTSTETCCTESGTDDCCTSTETCLDGIGCCANADICGGDECCADGYYCCTRRVQGVDVSHCIPDGSCCRNNQCPDDETKCSTGICKRPTNSFYGTCTLRNDCDSDEVCCFDGEEYACQQGPYCGCDVDGDCAPCEKCDKGTCKPLCDEDKEECCANLGTHGLCVSNVQGVGCCTTSDCDPGETCSSEGVCTCSGEICNDGKLCCVGDKPNCCTDHCVTGSQCCLDSECGTCGICTDGTCAPNPDKDCGTDCAECRRIAVPDTNPVQYIYNCSDCPTGQTCCGDELSECFDLRNDSDHCGTCDNACPSCKTCREGQCVDNCPTTGDVCCPDGQGGYACQEGPNCGCDVDGDCAYLTDRHQCKVGHCAVVGGVGTCTTVPADDTTVCHDAGASVICDPAITCDGIAQSCPEPNPKYPPAGTDCGDCEKCDGKGLCVPQCTGDRTQCCINNFGEYCIPALETCCDGPDDCPVPCEYCNDEPQYRYCISRCTSTETCCEESGQEQCCTSTETCLDGFGCCAKDNICGSGDDAVCCNPATSKCCFGQCVDKALTCCNDDSDCTADCETCDEARGYCVSICTVTGEQCCTKGGDEECCPPSECRDDVGCCANDDFCPGGSSSDNLCCTGNTTCCGANTNANACVDLSVTNNCCVDADCDPPDTCSDPDCLANHTCKTTSDCVDPMACCGGTECTNTDTDVNNCGICGNVCPSTQDCENGECQCPCDNCEIGRRIGGGTACITFVHGCDYLPCTSDQDCRDTYKNIDPHGSGDLVCVQDGPVNRPNCDGAFHCHHPCYKSDCENNVRDASASHEGSYGSGDCIPATCKDLNWQCGQTDDGCGGSLDCGTCPDGGTCDEKTHTCSAPECTPKTCADIETGTCGTGIDDGCKGTIDCGCADGSTCDDTGHCVTACVPTTCDQLAGQCGTGISDGCGGTIDCGCPDGSSCDATGQCVADCVPTACDGVTCGLIQDGCGGTIDCDCADGSVCNGSTCCTPEACAEGYCGLAEDGCGGTQNCTCPDDGSVCYNSQCCTPKTCADLEAGKCGLAEDGCGGTINCPC